MLRLWLLGAGTAYGEVDAVATAGFSNSAIALRSLMAQPSPYGQHLFDAALLMAATTHYAVDPTGTVVVQGPDTPLDFGTQRMLFVNRETEVIANGSFDDFGFVPVTSSLPMRAEADGVDRFLYEVAGAAHIDPVNAADLVAIGAVPPGTFATSNTLVWRPVVRAVFTHLKSWLATGAAPPASRLLDTPSAPEPCDPLYPGHPSVLSGLVVRDENLNATGGVRLPEVALGVGVCRAIGPAVDILSPDVTVEFLRWLAGGSEDVSCDPLPEGGSRFENHGEYVSAYAAEVRRLAAEGFLLPGDARSMLVAAAQSDIGKCG